MKRILFLLLAFSATCWLSISARVITPMEAQTTAMNVVDEIDGYGNAQFSRVILEVVSKTDESTPVLYIVNTYNRSLTRGHFVIMDATSGAVLAFGDGLLDQANIPDAMQLLLDYYQEQIECTLSQDSGGESVRMNTMMTSIAPVVKVGPLLTANWGQGAPYNDQCVFKNRTTQTYSRCLAGCGATALAQVMHKWRFPEASPPLSGSYSDTLQFEVPDLPSRIFDWENMLDSYTGEHSAPQDSAVAWLIRYAGQAQEMNYGVKSSGSSARRIVNALDLLGYNASWWIRSQTDSVTWAQKMISELDSGRPIIYSAGDSSNYATDSINYFHLFDIDGYETYADGQTKFHINWGWNGNGNGNGDFVLDNFNNTVSQIGQNHIWNVNQQMIVDIYPIVPQPPEVSVDSTALSFEELTGYTQSSSFIVRGDWLEQDIELSITGDDGGVFSFSNSTRITTMTITPDQAHCKKVTVFYSPKWESGVSSAVVNITSEVGLMTVDLSGKAIQSETYIEIDGEEEIDISFDDGHTGYAQEQTFNVMARIYYMKDGDETMYSEPLRSNVTLSIDFQGASCPFTVSPRTITPAQAYEGIPVTVKYYPKDGTEPVSTGKITLSTQGYDILSNPYGYNWPIVNLYCAHNAEPCIRVSEPSLSFDNWHTGYETSKTVIVSAYHTTGDIELSLDDPSGLFDISHTVIPADSAGKGVPVTVTYYPQQDGQHSATLTLTNPTAEALTVNIIGDATSASCVEVDSTSLSFEEYTGYTQTKTFKLKAYNLTEDITPQMRIISGRNRFTVTPEVISIADAEHKDGATVSVKYSPSVDNNQTNHSAKIIFSSAGENFAEMMLNGHSIKSDFFISVDSTSLAFNTTINQSVSKSIKVTIRNDSPYNGGNNGDPLYSWQGDGDGECDDMSGRQLNWRPPSGSLIDSINPIDHLDLMVFRECYAIIEGDDGFELDAPKFYYKKIEKEVYTICGLIFYMSQHQITDTVSVIFNPKDSKKLTRNARVTFYAPSSKPITVTLTGTVEINVQQGDVNGDSDVTIADVTSLIDYLLSGDSTGVSLKNADCNGDGSVTIVDVTVLIDYLLSGDW